MIDLHCHILPWLDDGARSLEDAVAMARQAAADGIEVVCATPHIRADHAVEPGDVAVRAGELDAVLHDRGVRVHVAPGGEVAEERLPELSDDDLRSVSLGGGGRWVLLEPRPGPLGDTLDEAVDELRRRGLAAVIAHPERHAGADLAERLRALCRRGALVQVTAALLADSDAAPAVCELAERGLVHVLGSDAHSALAGRPVRLSGAVAALSALPAMRPHVEWMTRLAPAAILAGQPVAPPFAAR